MKILSFFVRLRNTVHIDELNVTETGRYLRAVVIYFSTSAFLPSLCKVIIIMESDFLFFQ